MCARDLCEGQADLHIAALKLLAKSLSKLCQEGCESHAEGDHHKKEADCLSLEDSISDCLSTATRCRASIVMTLEKWLTSTFCDLEGYCMGILPCSWSR